MLGPIAFRHMMGGIQPFGGPGLLGLFLFLALTAIVVAAVIWAITRHKGTEHQLAATPLAPSAADSARQIARERLARGEIDPEQYRAIIEALST